MIDITKFFRVRENRLEVLMVGIVGESSYHAQKEGYPMPLTSKNRAIWISSKIKDYLEKTNIKRVVLDCRLEEFTNYVALTVINELELDSDQILVLTSTDPKHILSGYNYVIDRLGDIDTFFFYSNLVKRQIDWENIEIDIPLISLAARPTEKRARLTKKLADLCKDKIRISFGNVSNFSISDTEYDLYTKILDPYPFPFLLHTDRKFEDHPLDFQDYAGDNLFQSLVSVINETNDFDNNIIQLSEKSFKHFAWHQIPIFNASKGHVEVVRSLGFDVFDDIIDHSYDVAPNSHLQELKILSVIAKFLKDYPTLADVNKLRRHIFPRLQANNELLRKFNQERVYEPWPYYG